jgi:hypothetical protein
VILVVLILLSIMLLFSNCRLSLVLGLLLQCMKLVGSYHNLNLVMDECLIFLLGGMFSFLLQSFGFLRTMRKVVSVGVVQAQAPAGAQSRCRCCLQRAF